MPQETTDLAARIAEEAAALPPEKQSVVLYFVRFVKQAQAGQDEDGDAAWERIISDPRPRPKLEAFLREAAAEGEEPLDLNRL